MKNAKNLNISIELIILNNENIICVFIKKKFINKSAKNVVQYVLERKKNKEIMKIYHLNILLMVIIYDS